MSNDSQDIESLISYVGGEVNIDSVSHCATRLRFILKNIDQVDSKKVESLSFVKGSFYQGGQFQVIIGNEVAKYYSKTIEDGKIRALKDGDSNQEKIKNISWIQKVMERINKK